MHDRLGLEAVRGEPRVLGGCVGRAEAGKVHADEALHARANALGVGGVERGGEELDVAFVKHYAAVGGARRFSADLVHRDRRDLASELLPNRGRRGQVGHEMCDVIEIELARRRTLALRGIHAMDIAHFSGSRTRPFKLVFAESGPGPTLELGPFESVWLDGEALRPERGGAVLAEHRTHAWVVKGRQFFRLDCASMVRLHFEDDEGKSSPVCGPFTHFSCADGIAYGDGAIQANIDLETKLWYSHRDGRYWRSLVVTSAAAPAE